MSLGSKAQFCSSVIVAVTGPEQLGVLKLSVAVVVYSAATSRMSIVLVCVKPIVPPWLISLVIVIVIGSLPVAVVVISTS